MMLLAKAALGVSGALVAAGAYTFHEGVIRVDVDEFRVGGSHVHLWVPAAMVPMAMHFVPRRSEEHTSELQSRRDLVCRLLLEKKKKKSLNKTRMLKRLLDNCVI